jgi:DNA-binding GntR family transcriptional regulator
MNISARITKKGLHLRVSYDTLIMKYTTYSMLKVIHKMVVLSRGKQSASGLTPIKKPRVLRDVVYQELLQAILFRDIRPGQPLVETEIAERLQVSKTSVREAIALLASQGFVERRPHQTPCIRDFTDTDVEDIYLLRETLESLIVRLACRRCTSEDIDALRETVERAEVALAANDAEEYNEACSLFHEYLAESSKSTVVQNMLYPIRAQWVFVRKIQWLAASAKRVTAQTEWQPAAAVEEHKQLVKALENRDEEKAAKLIVEHVRRAKEVLLGHPEI